MHDRPIQPDGRLHGVILACRRDDGRWLLIRRGEGVGAAPGKVCFPGGAIEHGEPREDAAQREAREELGVEVALIKHVWHYELDERPLTLFGYYARLESHDFEPCPNEVAETLWLTTDEIVNHPDVLPHTDKFVEALMLIVD